MKKSKIWLWFGIAVLLASLIVDRIISNRYNLGMPMSAWSVAMWCWFVVDVVALLSSIGLIVYSRVLAKREKRAAAQARENVQ